MKYVRTKEELIKLVKKIMEHDGTEEEIDEAVMLLERSVPHPEVTNLIFWDDRDLTPEEIVEEALHYQPIITPPPNNDSERS